MQARLTGLDLDLPYLVLHGMEWNVMAYGEACRRYIFAQKKKREKKRKGKEKPKKEGTTNKINKIKKVGREMKNKMH